MNAKLTSFHFKDNKKEFKLFDDLKHFLPNDMDPNYFRFSIKLITLQSL